MDLLFPFASLPGFGLHLESYLLQSRPGMTINEKVSELNSSTDLKLFSSSTVMVNSGRIRIIAVFLIRFFALFMIRSLLGVFCAANIYTKPEM